MSQPTSSPQSPHLSDVLNTTIFFFCPVLSNHDFNSEILRHNWGMGLLLARSVVSAGTDMLLYLHLKPKQFSSTVKGQKWGKVDISCSLSLSLYLFLLLPSFLSLPLSVSLVLQCKGRDEASDRERGGDSVQGPWRNAREREMEDKKSERGRDDRMRKLTEGDGGSWVNLSSKSSQSRPIPISSSPRQESFSPWPCLPLCLWRKDGARLSMIGDGHYLNTILELGPTPRATAVRLETTLMRREMMGQPATPSPFIKSDKMVSTLSRNARQPPSTSTFSQSATLSAFVYTQSLYPTCLLAPHTFILWNTYTVPGAFQSLRLILSSPVRAFF